LRKEAIVAILGDLKQADIVRHKEETMAKGRIGSLIWLLAPRRLAERAPFAGNDRVLRARSLHPLSGWVSYEVGACRDLQEPGV